MFIKILCFAAAIICAFSPCCSATKIADVPLDELFSHSDYVASVRVDYAEALSTATRQCGHRYTSTVTEGIKGISSGELLEWNTLDGYANDNLEIGNRYIVFLTKPGKDYNPIMSTNAYSEKRRADFEEVCGSVLQGNRLIHEGHGALPIETSMVLDAGQRELVGVPPVIVLPKVLVSKFIDRKAEQRDPFYDWVKLEDFLAYLKTLPLKGKVRR
jgi:hypothetical protein